MKITIVCQYFYPEEFKVNDLAEEWVKRGHNVTVLTGKPNYPKGKILNGYKFWGIQEEDYKGIRVIRVPLIPRGNGGGIRLALNYLSFVFFASLYVLTHRIETDSIFCFGTSPVFQMYPALLLKKKTGVKAFFMDSRLMAGKCSSRKRFEKWVCNELIIKIGYRYLL